MQESELQQMLRRRLSEKGINLSTSGLAYISPCQSNNSSEHLSRDPLLVSQQSLSNMVEIPAEAVFEISFTQEAQVLDKGSEIIYENTEWLKEESTTTPVTPPVMALRDDVACTSTSQPAPTPVSNRSYNDVASTSFIQNSIPEEIDWKAKYKILQDRFSKQKTRLTKLKKKLARLEKEKAESDEYSLSTSKELRNLKELRNISQVQFTEHDSFQISSSEIEEYNQRAATDSIFASYIAIHLLSAERLKKMSVSGLPSHRFLNVKNADGSLKYPASEKIEPKLLEFICDKVAERTALRVGSHNVLQIRKSSQITKIKKYIANKISNLRRARRP
ncbi:uncharacterized protein LOC129755730 [Uranotaenia lowii]|uniref:uncharacterized protein LOC129755730 n=1 Tax=Uranotaenia lowii TaxID=190385 RepID=UPI0024792861|nr:uncharacterized protein LOC129755730 [Uranotaenia lowii]XP_055608328.1 uncharacterized protein LOC129755730 [Uranotaenia lowii]